MPNVICDIEDCKYRSKRRMRNYIKKNGKYCYKCTLKVINIRDESTNETDKLFDEEFPCCKSYQKMEEISKQ